MAYYNNSGSSSSDSETPASSGTTNVTAQNTIQGVGATSDTSVIVSRMQQRRGLKQDLPQPLRPGELGFTTDSQQLFIGADPGGAPSFVKTSVFESTPGSKAITESIVNHQLFSVNLPFKKYAKGEFTGSAQTVSWLPTSRKVTGSSANVFNTVITDNDSVKSIITNSKFNASDIIVKKNGIRLLGNSITDYGNLTTEDYIFSSGVNASDAHSITFRTRPLPSDEVTISYYSQEAVNRSLTSNISTQAHPGGSIYAGSPFKSFYTEYNVPSWDQLDPDLIAYSDTTGSGFIGLDFKHISVRTFSGPISSPNNASLGILYAHRQDYTIGDTGNIIADPANTGVITIPVGTGQPFSNTGINSHIVLDAGAINTPDVSEGIWMDKRWLPIQSYESGNVTASISMTGQGYRVGTFVSAGTAVEISLDDDRLYAGISQNDVLYFYGSQSGNANGITVTVTNDPEMAGTIVGAGSSSLLETITGATFVNYGPTGSGSNIQIVSISHGISSFNSDASDQGNPGIWVHQSTDTGIVPVSNTTRQYLGFKASRLQTDENCFFIPRSGTPAANITIEWVADTEVGQGFAWMNDAVAIDLSSATSVDSAIALIDDAERWPKLVKTPDSITSTAYTVFMQSPATDSVGHGFVITEDPVTPTLSVLSLVPGSYDLGDTRKSQLEKWFDKTLSQDDLALYNIVDTAIEYTTDGSLTKLGEYTYPINDATNEIIFDTREEAEAFNQIVNNLYFRRTNSDIRGLVNIKTNLEIEIRDATPSGEPTLAYLEPNEADIPSNALNTEISGLEFNVATYDTYFIEYTISESAGVVASPGFNYARIGEINILGRPETTLDGDNIGQVILLDKASDYIDNYSAGEVVDGKLPDDTVAIEFSSTITEKNVQIIATNNTGLPLKMKYIVRKWKSLDN